MQIKLDENLGNRAIEVFRKSGYDVTTIAEQNLCGVSDIKVIEVCKEEKRCLVTLDLDFSNPFRFPPQQYHGIAVLRLPSGGHSQDLFDAIHTLMGGLARQSIDRKLWIIQRGKIREYLPESE